MIRLLLLRAFVLAPTLACMAEQWPLDAVDSQIAVLGKAKVASGARDTSLVLDGVSLIELKETAVLNGESGFTFSVWFNPYAVNEGQQVIAGKNRYSLNERQWSLTVEPDGRLKAYVQQGGWATVTSKEVLKQGHWHLATLTVRAGKAALFLNGQSQGEVKLKKPIPATQAPITLGGIHDAGRRTQTFSGAVDEARFVAQVMSVADIAKSYQPVTATHEIPKAIVAETPLWDYKVKLPKAAELTVLDGVEFHVIKANEPEKDGYIWLHGVGLGWHKSKLYASFGHNKGEENTPGEQARGRVSSDGGKTWGESFTIGAGDSPEHAVSHGVFLSHGGELWAFHGSFYGHSLTDITKSKVHTRTYRLNETTNVWEPKGTVIEGGFWALNQPVKMADGNWIMPGISVGNGHCAAVAISRGDDFLKWDLVVIPAVEGLTMWGESSIIVDGPKVANIARFGAKAQALIAVSKDYGRTFNARCESVFELASYRGPILRQRCLIPVRGWHEWPGRTTPYFIHRTDEAPLLLAGIWDVWESPYPEDFESGAIVTSMSIVTTPPGRYMAKFHDRSPLILEGETALAWMQPGMQADDLRALFRPYESEHLEAYRVSTAANQARNKSEEVLLPVAPPVPQSGDEPVKVENDSNPQLKLFLRTLHGETCSP